MWSCKQTLEKTEVAIKNGKSRGTGNVGHIRHGTKTKSTTQHNTENLKYEQHGPHQMQQPLVLY